MHTFVLDPAGAITHIVALLDCSQDLRVPRQRDTVSLAGAAGPRVELHLRDPVELVAVEWQEEQDLVDSAQEFVAPKVCAQNRVHGAIHKLLGKRALLVFGRRAQAALRRLRAQGLALVSNFALREVRRHDEDGLLALDRVALHARARRATWVVTRARQSVAPCGPGFTGQSTDLPIGEPSFVKELQHHR